MGYDRGMRIPKYPSLGLAGLLLTLPLWLFGACDLGSVTDGDPPTDTTQPKATATLTLTNQKTKDPGTMAFKLWGPLAVEILEAVPQTDIGDVPSGATKVFTVPAGDWKIGYQLDGLEFQEMPDSDTSGSVWPKLRFAKGGKYSLTITTNEIDNRDYWQHNFNIVP